MCELTLPVGEYQGLLQPPILLPTGAAGRVCQRCRRVHLARLGPRPPPRLGGRTLPVYEPLKYEALRYEALSTECKCLGAEGLASRPRLLPEPVPLPIKKES
jgi:hypothetical protein